MKSYKKFEDLLKDIEGYEYKDYAENELENFLAFEDSNIDSIEPINNFALNIEGKIYKIGVTSTFDGENSKHTYWIVD